MSIKREPQVEKPKHCYECVHLTWVKKDGKMLYSCSISTVPDRVTGYVSVVGHFHPQACDMYKGE